MPFRPNYPCTTNCCFQCFDVSVHTPMAEVRWDDEKVRRVCQVFAEQFPIFLFFWLTKRTHQHRHDAKLVFVAATSDYWVNHFNFTMSKTTILSLMSRPSTSAVRIKLIIYIWLSWQVQLKSDYMIPVFHNQENPSPPSPANLTDGCMNYAHHPVHVSLHQCDSGLQYSP